jgi:hypothetical protein
MADKPEHLQLTESIRFNTEVIKLLGFSVLATISGIVTLFYQTSSFGKTFVFGFLGMVLICIQGFIVSLLYKRNIDLIAKIK